MDGLGGLGIIRNCALITSLIRSNGTPAALHRPLFKVSRKCCPNTRVLIPLAKLSIDSEIDVQRRKSEPRLRVAMAPLHFSRSGPGDYSDDYVCKYRPFLANLKKGHTTRLVRRAS